MTALAVILAAALVALGVVFAMREREGRAPKLSTGSPRRILFPFIGTVLSQRGLDAALRLARIDGATLVPVFLARVPMHLPLDAALPVQCDGALPLLEAIEQRAVRSGVAVDARIERGRSYRHAIRELIDHESFDTVVVTAADTGSSGLLPDDISWLLEHVPGEIIVIRPGPVDLQDFLTSGPGARQYLRQSRSWRASGRRPADSRTPPRSPASGGRSGPP
jgi:universal stress protein family protein